MENYQRCSRCLYDTTIPNIKFDEKGVCNYCALLDQFSEEYPTGDAGMAILTEIASKIKEEGKNNQYDVVVGVSGGCDSSYVLYLAKKLGLRPLAVHWDNSFNTEIAKNNMENVIAALGVTLETVTVDPEEYADICRSFLKSGVGDIDIPNDIALTAALYRVADKHHVKSIFIGHSFRTEGIAPIGWTYMDGAYIEDVQKKFGTMPLRTYPNLLIKDFLKYMMTIKRYRPLYYVSYIKEDVKKMLAKEFNFEWYGGHHQENIFTSFEMDYFLPKRYGIDMRLLGHSAHVRSGQMTRKEAIKELSVPVVCKPEVLKEVLRRLNIEKYELDYMMSMPEKTHLDFKTYDKTFKRLRPFLWIMYKLHRIPKSFYVKYAK